MWPLTSGKLVNRNIPRSENIKELSDKSFPTVNVNDLEDLKEKTNTIRKEIDDIKVDDDIKCWWYNAIRKHTDDIKMELLEPKVYYWILKLTRLTINLMFQKIKINEKEDITMETIQNKA